MFAVFVVLLPPNSTKYCVPQAKEQQEQLYTLLLYNKDTYEKDILFIIIINFKTLKTMEKKNLKWYDAPQVEVVEMEMEGMLCLSTGFAEGEGGGGGEIEFD